MLSKKFVVQPTIPNKTVKKAFFLSFLFLSLTGVAQNKPTATNSQNSDGFDLDVSFYPTNNNFVKEVVKVSDGYILSGQHFKKENTQYYNSALVKISNDGTLLRELFSGDEKDPNDKISNQYVFSFDKNRILQLGEKDRKRLWIRELDKDLNVLKDTLYDNVPVTLFYKPHLFEVKNGFYLLSNSSYYRDQEINVTYINNDLKQVENNVIQFTEAPFHFFRKEDSFSATYDAAKGVFYILLHACPERLGDSCDQYKIFLLEYDIALKKVTRYKAIEENTYYDKIHFKNNTLYITGLERNLPNKGAKDAKPKQKSVIKVYSTNFDKLKEYQQEWDFNLSLYDAVIAEDKIHLGGDVFNKALIKYESLYLVYSLDGKLLEKKTFSSKVPHSENRILKILPLGNGKYLLAGKGNGWHVVIK